MLEFQELTILKEGRKVIDDFSLRIEEGAIFGLLGSDGREKSALIQCAAGELIPDRGDVLLDGDSVFDSRAAIYKRVGYMPEHYGFYEQLHVDEYLAMLLSLYKILGRNRDRRIQEVLELIGMREYEHAPIGDVPSEYLPFLCLGKAVIHEPSWLFLDEPFLNMSVSERSDMVRTILMLAERGVSVVLNSQPYAELKDIYSGIAVVNEGRLQICGTPEEVYQNVAEECPIRMHLTGGLSEALAVLRENPMVERVVVNDMDIIFRFLGDEKDQASLLTDLVLHGAQVHYYKKDRSSGMEWREYYD